MNAPHVEVLLLEGDALVVRARSATVHGTLGRRVSRGEAPLSWAALESGRPVSAADASLVPHARSGRPTPAPRSVIELPILRGEERLGVISLARSEPERPFTELDVQHGESLARQVALVLHNAGQYADAVEEVESRTADLRESEERLAFALDATSDGLWDWDITSGTVHYSRQWERLLGFQEGEALSRIESLIGAVHPEDVPEVQRVLDAHLVDHAELQRAEIRLRAKSGEFRWFDLQGRVVVRATDGSAQRMVGTVTDVSDRRRAVEARTRLETQLQRAMKLESVGRLAGGVAHDFNNMLAVIMGHVELTLERLDPSHPAHADLLEISRTAERSADLTRQLLAFARQQPVAPKVLDLNKTVGGLRSMLQRMIGEDIVIRWEPAADLWPVRMDPSQMDQVLTNLCVNARDAIAGVGHVTIATANCTIDGEFCEEHPSAVPGEYVRLSVRDSGAGMDRETLSQIFEPFFSTKAHGEGTGLGLATVYGAVTQNGGFVAVESEVGGGALLEVYLPRLAEVTEQPVVAPAKVAGSRGEETIMIVEDEPAILSLLTKGLRSRGYEVIGATSPKEALRIAEERESEIHLLLTDVIMPEMNGRDLANALAETRPALRVLFMSGYTADVIARHGVLDDAVRFIGKPFSVAALTEAVRAGLDASRG